MQLSLTQHVVALMPLESGGGGQNGLGSPIKPHNGELVFGLLLFIVFLIILVKKVVPRIEEIYQQRAEAIEGDMGRAERALAEAESVKAQYERDLAQSRAEAGRIREEAREQGAAIIAEMRDQAQVEAARILENAQRQIEAERVQAMAQLKGEVGRMSTDLASRIVGESLQDEVRQRGIVERFLQDFESGRITSTHVKTTTAGPDGEI